MREVTVRIKYTSPCLGNVPDRSARTGRLVFHRNHDGQLVFLPTWHLHNMTFAAQLLGKAYSDVSKIQWDQAADCVLRQPDPWYRRYYTNSNGRRRFAVHEAVFPGQVVGFNCVLPATIDDDTFIRLMEIAGRYKGLSPFRGAEFGRYVPEEMCNRRAAVPPAVVRIDSGGVQQGQK